MHLVLVRVKAGQLVDGTLANLQVHKRTDQVLNAHVLEDRRELQAHRFESVHLHAIKQQGFVACDGKQM